MMKTRANPLPPLLSGIDGKLASVFVPWALRHPRYIRGFMRICRAHRKAARLRKEAEVGGLKVPPFMILSVTSSCNLRCAGCYAAAAGVTGGEGGEADLSMEEWKAIIKEASSIGVLGFVIAGGEPFMLEGLPELCTAFPDRLFIIVTNGTALHGKDFGSLRKSSNIAVLVSMDGAREHTDPRRGEGVHDRAAETLAKLSKAGVPSGISATITRSNLGFWTDEKNVRDAIGAGATIGVFLEHIPVDGKDSPCSGGMLTRAERKKLRSRILEYRERLPIYIVHSPGDEEFFGGCVSSGRGFVHVTPKGMLTPCPVSGFAVADLRNTRLSEALKSPMLRYIRENHGMLETGDSPCALYDKTGELSAAAKKLKC